MIDMKATVTHPSAADGMYSQLIDEYPPGSQFIQDVQPRGGPVHRGLWPPAGRYRRATVLLSVLCLVLLVCLIAVASHRKGVSVSEGETGEGQTRRQEQEVNVTSLEADLRLLQQENAELRAKLAANATRAPPAVSCTTAAPVVRTTTTTTTAAPVATMTTTTVAPVATTTTAAPVATMTTTTVAPVATAAAPVTTAAAVCPAAWLSFQGSCYRVSRQTADWRGAQRLCQRDGGQLAVILTAQQQVFLWDLLPRGHWNSFWFGLTDQHTEDVWTWVDGTPLLGGFWEEGEPNNHIDEDCGYIVKTLTLERVAVRSWYDAPCSMYLPFICQKVPIAPKSH